MIKIGLIVQEGILNQLRGWPIQWEDLTFELSLKKSQ